MKKKALFLVRAQDAVPLDAFSGSGGDNRGLMIEARTEAEARRSAGATEDAEVIEVTGELRRFLASRGTPAEHQQIAKAVKETANGMLPIEVYLRLYDIGRSIGGGVMIEVGTAHGAATIALALGAKSAGHAFKIITVDPFGGALSSRSQYGSVSDNVNIVRRNFAAFDVADHIEIIVGTSADLPSDEIAGASFLMIDADGRIDRDLALIYDHLAPDATIVLDDIDDATFAYTRNGRRILDQKHRIASLLTKAYVDAGVLTKPTRMHSTGFYEKGSAPSIAIEKHAINAYRELVFAEIPPATLRDTVKRNFPQAVRLVRAAKKALGR